MTTLFFSLDTHVRFCIVSGHRICRSCKHKLSRTHCSEPPKPNIDFSTQSFETNYCCYFQKNVFELERVKGVAKILIFSLWLAYSSHSSQWYLCILTRDWYYIQKGSKLLMCTLISLLKQYFLLLITFCTYFERCSNFEFEAV